MILTVMHLLHPSITLLHHHLHQGPHLLLLQQQPHPQLAHCPADPASRLMADVRCNVIFLSATTILIAMLHHPSQTTPICPQKKMTCLAMEAQDHPRPTSLHQEEDPGSLFLTLNLLEFQQARLRNLHYQNAPGLRAVQNSTTGTFS